MLNFNPIMRSLAGGGYCLLVLLGAEAARACSMMCPTGVDISSLQATGSSGSLLLSIIDNNDDCSPRGTAHATFDFASGVLSEAEQPTSAESVGFGIALNMSNHLLDANSTSSGAVSINGVSFALPGQPSAWSASRDAWWYSASLARYFFLYATDTSTSLVVCTNAGACAAPVDMPAGSNYYDAMEVVEVYDALKLVALPLQCCVCISRMYYTFDAGNITPVPVLNTINPYAYDAATDTIYGARRSYADPDADPVVESFVLSTGATASQPVSLAQLRELVAVPPRPPAPWVIRLAVVGGALLLLAIIGIAAVVRRRRIGTCSGPPKAAVGQPIL